MKFAKLLLIFFIAMVYSTAVAQTGWFIIPGVTAETLNEIKTSAGIQWVVGNNGTIFKTTDNGDTWVSSSSGVTVDLRGFYSPTSNQYWVAGDAGTVIVTTNAGNTWVLRSPASNTNFSCIFSRGSGTAYAIGEAGTCFYSSDLGTSWEYRPVPTSENLNTGVGPTSGTTLHALVGGNNGVIFKTTDAGVNWNSSNSGTVNNINGFGFGAGGKIFAVGSNGTLLETNDAGDTWSSVSIPTNEDLYSVSSSVQNANWLIACGGNGTIIKSTDGGVVWFLQSTPNTETLYSALAASNNIHFAVGSNGIILKTTDGGGDPVTVEDDQKIPVDFELRQNYPNPFNPSTTINFLIPEASFVSLKVFNSLGEEVKTLVAKELSTGNYKYYWDAKNFTSGFYFYKIQAGDFFETKKMILIK